MSNTKRIGHSIIISLVLIVLFPVFAYSAPGAAGPVGEYGNAGTLISGLEDFLLEIDQQETAGAAFRAKLHEALDNAVAECPVDFTGLVAELDAMTRGKGNPAAELKMLRRLHEKLARQYAEADRNNDVALTKNLLPKLKKVVRQIDDAKADMEDIHPLRLELLRSLFSAYVGKTCPAGMVYIDGTFCMDVYEAANEKDDFPRVGLNYNAARALCAEAGKRLCTGDEWRRACLGPACGLNRDTMRPFRAADCNAGLDAAPGRGVDTSGAVDSCLTPEGIADLFGNVWEWVDEDYKTYYRIIYGGAGRSERYASCSNRTWALPDVVKSYYGARCCADPGALQPAEKESM